MRDIIHVKQIFKIGTIKFTKIAVLFCTFSTQSIVLQHRVRHGGEASSSGKGQGLGNIPHPPKKKKSFQYSKNRRQKMVQREPQRKRFEVYPSPVVDFLKTFLHKLLLLLTQKRHARTISCPRKLPNTTPDPPPTAKKITVRPQPAKRGPM